MKAVFLSALVACASVASPVNAADTVRACIAASTEGQTLRDQGKLLAARDAMITCARDACPPIVRGQCARWLSEVDAAIPGLVVRAVDAAGADVVDARLSIDERTAKLDGKPVRLDPGEHSVAVVDERGARKEERVLLVQGEASRLVTLRFPARASAPLPVAAGPGPEPQAGAHRVPTGAWILGGLGVALLGGATYFGLAAKSDLDALKSSCSPHCDDAQTQPGRTDALLFDVFLGAGAAAVGAAVLWGLAFPAQMSHRTAAPHLELRPIAGGGVAGVRFSY